MISNRKIIYTTIAGISMSLVLASCSTTDNNDAAEPKTSEPQSAVSRPPKKEVEKKFTYKDGVYKATGLYGGLPSRITVTATLDDDVLTDVKVTTHATNKTSLDLQKRFADAVPKVVVGKRIDEVKVGKLAGSSDTPDGFNSAIQQIKEEAQEEQ